MFGRKPYGRDIDRVNQDIVDKEKEFRRSTPQEQASFLQAYSRTAIPKIHMRLQIRRGMARERLGRETPEPHVTRLLSTELQELVTYFDRTPAGGEQITDANIVRAMTLISTLSYSDMVGLPEDAIWTVYEGVLATRHLAPLAR